MNQPAKTQEPSMEEILASIRRIIADDDANKTAKPAELPPVAAAIPARPAPPPPRSVAPPMPAAATPAAPAPSEVKPPPAAIAADVLDLTEAMASPAQAPSFRTIDGESDVVFSDRPPTKAAEAMTRAIDDGGRAGGYAFDRGILANSTVNAVDSAFNSLANTVLGQNARTLEDLVREMLRPMLKSWLDDNLPGLVERLVRAEIERVSRGRS
jgi:cell pole-organizing protein PopZ